MRISALSSRSAVRLLNDQRKSQREKKRLGSLFFLFIVATSFYSPPLSLSLSLSLSRRLCIPNRTQDARTSSLSSSSSRRAGRPAAAPAALTRATNNDADSEIVDTDVTSRRRALLLSAGGVASVLAASVARYVVFWTHLRREGIEIRRGRSSEDVARGGGGGRPRRRARVAARPLEKRKTLDPTPTRHDLPPLLLLPPPPPPHTALSLPSPPGPTAPARPPSRTRSSATPPARQR